MNCTVQAGYSFALTGLVTDTLRYRSPRPCCKPALKSFDSCRSLFRAYPKLVYCCDFQSTELRKHSEVGLITYSQLVALQLLVWTTSSLKVVSFQASPFKAGWLT